METSEDKIANAIMHVFECILYQKQLETANDQIEFLHEQLEWCRGLEGEDVSLDRKLRGALTAMAKNFADALAKAEREKQQLEEMPR